MTATFDLVFVGLSLSSSWGNGHATTYRALLRGLAADGHRILFLERDAPWYAANRDLGAPDFCAFALYDGVDDLRRRFGARIASADAVIVGSYVPEGVAVIDLVLATAGGVTAFYDIDTPVTLAGLGRSVDYIAPRQIPRLDLYFSFSGGDVLDRLAREHGARRPCALYCAVDETRYGPDAGAAKMWDLGYLGTYSADRQPALQALLVEPARRLPQCRFVVAGPQYPADIAWPANVERIEHLAPADHAAFYRGQRFTLNVTRADMVAAGWSPSVRLFEAAACGTAIISDRWRGLSEIFPEGDAILIADGPDAVVAALEDRSDRAAKLGDAARRIALAAHTGSARAGTFARQIEAAMAPMATARAG